MTGVDAKEIFELIIKADEKLKYANDANAELRRGQARTLLEQARDEARAAGIDAIVAAGGDSAGGPGRRRLSPRGRSGPRVMPERFEQDRAAVRRSAGPR